MKRIFLTAVIDFDLAPGLRSDGATRLVAGWRHGCSAAMGIQVSSSYVPSVSFPPSSGPKESTQPLE